MQIIQLRLRSPLFDIIPNNSILVAISETMKIKPHIYEIRYLQECLDLAFNCDNTTHDRNIRLLHQRIVARLQQSGKKAVVSERTIRRIFSFNGDNGFHELSLLDCVQAIGYAGWGDFQAAAINHETYFPLTNIKSTDLSAIRQGEIITIGWLPHKYVTLECIEDWKFKILETSGFGRKKGEIIEASGFVLLHRPGSIYPEIQFEIGDERTDFLDKEPQNFDDLFPSNKFTEDNVKK